MLVHQQSDEKIVLSTPCTRIIGAGQAASVDDYAARFNVTMGRCRRFLKKSTVISNRCPGFPATST
jgi:hypothetical protein